MTIGLMVGCSAFQCINAGCNEQEFFLNPKKNLAEIRLVVFEKNAKNAHFNSEKMTSPVRRLGYSNNQLNC